MEVINDNNKPENDMWKDWENSRRRGRLFGGLFIIGAGVLFLLREMGVWIPEWIFSWQMLIIAIGLYIGLKHAFRSFGWIIMVLVGSAFLIREFVPWLHAGKFFWPIAIILAGIFIIFKPRRNMCEGRMEWQKYSKGQDFHTGMKGDSQDKIEFNAIFGSISKNIITKTFKGGEVNVVFGGAEINLMHADFSGTIELEVNAIFGGARLIMPSNWNVKSEIAAVLGGVEDKRAIQTDITSDPDKVLVLRGNAIFGGIEIKSYS